MRSSTVFASALAFAASVFAQTDGYAVMTSPTKGSSVPSGKTFTIVWEAGKYTGDATISLLGGDSPTTLVPGATLGTVDVAAGSFDWPVDCSLGKEKTYGIKITSAASPETFQYSFPFAISGPSCSSGAGSYPTLSSSVLISSTSSSTSTKSSSTSSVSSSSTTSTVETTSTSTSSTTVISSYVAITSAANNLSTTAVPTYSGTTILTTTSAAVVTPTGSSTTTSSVPVATGAANSAAAGSFALVGALAFAVMAM